MPDLLEQAQQVDLLAPDLVEALNQALLNADPPAAGRHELFKAEAEQYSSVVPDLSFASFPELGWMSGYSVVGSLHGVFIEGDTNEAVTLIVRQTADAFAQSSPASTVVAQRAASAVVLQDKPTADEFLAWLDSEDFGDEPDRVRREAWGQ